MLKKSKEIVLRIGRNLRDGAGKVCAYDFLSKEESGIIARCP